MKGVSGAWSNQGFGHPSLGSFRPILQRVGSSMLCTVFREEISDMFAIGDLERSPPTIILVPALFKYKSGDKGLCQFRMPGSLNFIE